MKMQASIIQRIRKNSMLRRELAYKLGISDQTIARHLRENSDNGDLTKYFAMTIIGKHLGIKIDDLIE